MSTTRCVYPTVHRGRVLCARGNSYIIITLFLLLFVRVASHLAFSFNTKRYGRCCSHRSFRCYLRTRQRIGAHPVSDNVLNKLLELSDDSLPFA